MCNISVFLHIACMVIHESNGLDALRMVHKLELAPHCQRVADERAGACYKRLCGTGQSLHSQRAASFTNFRAKLLLQAGHLNGFSSVWVAICRARCSWRAKEFGQISQGYFRVEDMASRPLKRGDIRVRLTHATDSFRSVSAVAIHAPAFNDICTAPLVPSGICHNWENRPRTRLLVRKAVASLGLSHVPFPAMPRYGARSGMWWDAGVMECSDGVATTTCR